MKASIKQPPTHEGYDFIKELHQQLAEHEIGMANPFLFAELVQCVDAKGNRVSS